MTGERFVKLCFNEKEATLKEYFNAISPIRSCRKIRTLTERGISKDDLYVEKQKKLLTDILWKNNGSIRIGRDLKIEKLW